MRIVINLALGLLVVGICSSVVIGVRRMVRGDIVGSQKMMRWRVGLQFMAIALLIIAYTYTKHGGSL